MDNNKLKELEKFFKETIWSLGRDERLGVLDLITAYRQLEKDVARLEKSNDMLTEQRNEDWVRADKAEEAKSELLAALNEIRDGLYHRNDIQIKNDFRLKLKAIAQKAITKHKGE